MMAQQIIKFYNGNMYPMLGLGTWKSAPNVVGQAVKDAIDIGYRHIDCARVYSNEKEIGSAIKSKINEGEIDRDSIFITSKLWNTYHQPDLVESALRQTLNDLCLESLDLYLLHWPFAFKEGDILFPMDSHGKFHTTDVDYIDTWKAMEKLLEKGLVKNIGVSNFNIEQLKRLLANTKIKPVTNQIECHAYLTQQKLSEFCNSHGITITAYSPFASPDRQQAKPDDPKPLKSPVIKTIANKYNKTPAQIILRHQIQRGHLVVPKSVSRSRIQENFNISDFNLDEKDMVEIEKQNSDTRVCTMSGAAGHKYYPFE